MKIPVKLPIILCCLNLLACDSDTSQGIAQSDSMWLNDLASVSPCSQMSFDIRPQRDSVSCVLASAIVREIGAGKAEAYGYPQSDSARISSLLISEQIIEDGVTGGKTYYWRTDVSIEGRTDLLDAIFDRKERTIGLVPKENWLK